MPLLSTDTPHPKLPSLGKVKLPTNPNDPKANEKASITQAVSETKIAAGTADSLFKPEETTVESRSPQDRTFGFPGQDQINSVYHDIRPERCSRFI